MGSCTSKQNVEETKKVTAPSITRSLQIPQQSIPVQKSLVQIATSTEDLAYFPEFFYFDRAKGSILQINKDRVVETILKSSFNFPSESAITLLSNGNFLSVGGVIKNSLVRTFFSIDIQSKVISELPNLPLPCKLGQLHLIGDWVYYIGGIRNAIEHLEQAPLLRFSPSLGKWEDLWRYGEQFQFDKIINMGTCALGNKLFLVGGQKISSSGLIKNNKKIYSISVEDSFKVQVEGKIPFKVLNPVIANGRKNAVVTGGTKPKSLGPNRGSFFIIAQNDGVKIIKISDIGIDLNEKYPGIYDKDTAIFVSRPYVVIRTKKVNRWIGFEFNGKDSRKCLHFKVENRLEDESSDDSCGIEKASRLNFVGERQVADEKIIRYSSVYSESPRKSERNARRSEENLDEEFEILRENQNNEAILKSNDCKEEFKVDENKIAVLKEIEKKEEIKGNENEGKLFEEKNVDIHFDKSIEKNLDGSNNSEESKSSSSNSSDNDSDKTSRNKDDKYKFVPVLLDPNPEILNNTSIKSSSSSSSKPSSYSSKSSSNSSKSSSYSSKFPKFGSNQSKPASIPVNFNNPPIPIPIPNLKIPLLYPQVLLTSKTNESVKKTITISSSSSDSNSSSGSNKSNSSSGSNKSNSSSSEENNELDLFSFPLDNPKPVDNGLFIDLEEQVVNKKPAFFEENPSNIQVIDDFVVEINPGFTLKPQIKISEEELSVNFEQPKLNPDLNAPKPSIAINKPEFVRDIKKSDFNSKIEGLDLVSKDKLAKPKLLVSHKSVQSFKPLKCLNIKPIKPFIAANNFRSEVNLLKSPSPDFFVLNTDTRSLNPFDIKNNNKSQDFGEIYYKTISSSPVPNYMTQIQGGKVSSRNKVLKIKLKKSNFFSGEYLQKLIDIVSNEFKQPRNFCSAIKDSDSLQSFLLNILKFSSCTIINLNNILKGIPLIFNKNDFNNKEVICILLSAKIPKNTKFLTKEQFSLSVYKAYKVAYLKKN